MTTTSPHGASDVHAALMSDESARGIEVRSIDHIPASERHGRVFPLAAVWVAGNANVGTLVVGMVGIWGGADLFWTLLGVLTGCAFGAIFAALHSTQGPHLGLPQLVQSRPQFGYYGALVVFLLALVTYVGFNVFVNVLGGQTLQVVADVPATTSYVIVTVAAALIALVGYRWIHVTSRALTLATVVAFVALTAALLFQGGLTADAFAPGPFPAVAFLLQFGAAAGYQINWAIYVSDYTRYLPETVSSRGMFWCTYLGMSVSAAWFGGLGALMATSFPDLDAVAGSQAAGNLLFGGFGNVVLVVSLLGLVVVGAMNIYGSSLTLISAIDSLATIRFTRRLRMVTVAAFAGLTFALTSLASGSFLAAFSGFLTILLYVFAPWTAVNLTDYFVVRRGTYSVRDIFSPSGIYGRWNTRGLIAYAIAFAAEMPFAKTTWFEGPLCTALGGADIAPFVGVAVGGLVYALAYRNHDREAEAALIRQERELEESCHA